MAAARIALVVEPGPAAGSALAVAEACRARGIEATIALSAAEARAGGPFVALAKTLDAGVRLPALPAGFAPATDDYEAVLFAAGRVPSCVLPDGPLPPDAYPMLAEWNVRAVVGAHGPVSRGVPYFLGGRLQLAGLGANYLAGDDLHGLADAAAARVAALRAAHGGVAVVRVAGAAHGAAPRFLDALVASGAEVGSVRTAWNALQDIPYDHAIPLAALHAMAQHAARGVLAPFRYELGYLAPAEQLALIAQFWATALEKGKAGRNATPRCPQVRGAGETMVHELSAEAVAAAVKELHAAIRDRNEIPGAVAGLAAADLLPTLAAGFAAPLPPQPLPVVRGAFPPHAPCAAAGLLRWTFKPAIDFVPA